MQVVEAALLAAQPVCDAAFAGTAASRRALKQWLYWLTAGDRLLPRGSHAVRPGPAGLHTTRARSRPDAPDWSDRKQRALAHRPSVGSYAAHSESVASTCARLVRKKQRQHGSIFRCIAVELWAHGCVSNAWTPSSGIDP